MEEVSSGHLEDLYQYVEEGRTKYRDLRKFSFIKLMTLDGISDYDETAVAELEDTTSKLSFQLNPWRSHI